MAALTFISLPTEIRELIYSLVISDDVEVECCSEAPASPTNAIESVRQNEFAHVSNMLSIEHNRRVPLLRTNKQINMEVAECPETTVVLKLCGSDCLYDWLELKDFPHRELVRGIVTSEDDIIIGNVADLAGGGIEWDQAALVEDTS